MFCDVGEISETGSLGCEEVESEVGGVTIVCSSDEDVVGKIFGSEWYFFV